MTAFLLSQGGKNEGKDSNWRGTGCRRAKAQYDGHVKRILGNRQVLARILKGASEEFQEYSPEEIVGWIEPDIEIEGTALRPGETGKGKLLITGDSTESRIPGEGTISYDIRFRVYVPGQGRREMVKLLMNVEAQKKFYLKYRIVTRGIFYGARMLSEQLDREFIDSEYGKLKKVYSIWICMNAPLHIGNALTEYWIGKRDIIGTMPEKKKNYDKLSVIIICLNEKSKEKGGELHGFLNTLLSPRMNAARKKEVLLRDYGVEMEQEIGEELKQMCNLSEAIEEYAMREGVRKGVRKGISLTKNIMRLAGEGKSEEEISALCGVSAKMVREIMKA